MNIDRINQISMEFLRFRDFRDLKSGRDAFSRQPLEQLREQVSIAVFREAAEQFEGKELATCLRWILRGLDTEKAIRKVKTDIEVTENAIAAARGRRNAA